MIILSYNVNGIRAALSKGLDGWLKSVDADIVCLQEIKAQSSDIPEEVFRMMGYECFWYPAQKKGYSGVGILSKIKPLHVEYGMSIPEYDAEGRLMRIDLEGISVVSVYHPSGTMGEERQAFKMKWLTDFRKYIQAINQNHLHLLISGDFNICHKPVDIHDPVRNAGSSGFLPEEREWMTSFLESGFTDTFRYFNNEPHNYTWWSYRANARKRNLGWRIDYHMASNNLIPGLKRAAILPMAVHSDHCPVLLEILQSSGLK